MLPLLERVKAGPVLIADGAMGTLLIEHDLGPGGCPESLNLSRPELLVDVARRYTEAGAEILETNTFGGSPLKLASYDLDGRTEEINRRAVESAREGAQGRAYVAGSCGPSGRILEPYGDAAPDDVRASFRRQAEALVRAGVDALFVETMTDLAEARLAVEAARSVSPDIPVAATLTFDRTPRGFYTIMGVDVPGAAAGLLEAGADIVGSNCGNGVETMIEIARAFRAATHAPLLIQPNAGAPRVVDGRVVYDETPSFMAERAVALVRAGVQIVGGCCGTTPEHTRALSRALGRSREARDRLPEGHS